MSMFSMHSSKGAPCADGRLERVEVDHQQVDRRDAVRGSRRHVLGVVAHGQQAAVHLGCSVLTPAVHHLGEAGVLGDVLHGDAGVLRAPWPCRRSRGSRRRAPPARGQTRSRPVLSETEIRARRITASSHGSSLVRPCFTSRRLARIRGQETGATLRPCHDVPTLPASRMPAVVTSCLDGSVGWLLLQLLRAATGWRHRRIAQCPPARAPTTPLRRRSTGPQHHLLRLQRLRHLAK